MIKALTVAAALAAPALAYTPEALADQVTNLPGAENLELNFNQFSGYLTVNGTKNLHYWMVESTNKPASDPVAFWTNGGPGCSGLLGFLTEQGPFRPNKDMTLSLNEYAWNQVANMVFIEAPCGVGFSYSEDSADYVTNDAQTAGRD
jgi:carboxypeptidase C (cathepsin A)